MSAPFQVLAPLAAGFSASEGLKAQAFEADYNARNMELQGKQLSATRREELNRSFAALDAIRAGRNTSTGSPTDLAIRRDLRRRTRAAEDAEQLGVRVGVYGQRLRAAEYRRAAPFAMLKGVGDSIQAGESLVMTSLGGP